MYIYEEIRHNLVHRKCSFDFFMRLACTYFLSKKYESIVVIRGQFWRGRTKELAVLVNRIFPTLLAA